MLFNVIAGATAIPTELREASSVFRFSARQKWTTLILPGIFPYLITGLITASGGAWNASIVAEYMTFRDQDTTEEKVLQAWGLGAQISDAARHANFPVLAASILVMSLLVVLFNRTVWHRCYELAEKRFSLSK